MSQNAVESFLGRIITDKDFRQRAITSPEHACAGVGFSISMEEMVYLKSLEFSLFDQIAETVDDSIRRS